MTVQFYRNVAIAVLTGAIAACSSSPDVAVSVPNSESTPSDTVTTPADESSLVDASPNCPTWSDFQDYEAEVSGNPAVTYLQMPPGFEQGCIFKASMALSNPLYILRNDLAYEAVSATGQPLTPLPGDDLPWLDSAEVDYATLDALIAQGDLLTYYYACTTNAMYAANCEGYAQNRPYSLPTGDACFQGHCLEGGAISVDQRLALWSGYPGSDAEAATGLTAEQEAARRQYDEIPLATLFPELPVIHPNAEALAFETFGRTELGEGEQATEIELIATYDTYQVLLLTNFGAADDSIGGLRYRLEFEFFDNDQKNLIWVGEQRYCRRSTPPTWTNQLCP
ncbi:MAG: hypothetical protein EA367_06945 [Leptolyngbya sp. DLM2.Bin15]|nr:MAG: hypothetical protein EA367_06945 [Leptolyngbya sp. DLM2.Bin15]